MMLYYDASAKGYKDAECPSKDDPVMLPAEFRKLRRQGKIVSLRGDRMYPGLKFVTKNHAIFITLDNMALERFDSDCIGYYRSVSEHCRSLHAISKRYLINPADEGIIRKACRDRVDYDVIFDVLDASFPHTIRYGKNDRSADDMIRDFLHGKKICSDSHELPVYEFVLAIYYFLKHSDDSQKCYYELKRSEHGYPSISDVVSYFEGD